MALQSNTQEESSNEAIERLSLEFRHSLVRYYSRRVKENHDIEDLVQEVFYRLLKRASNGDVEIARGYVFETASSVLKDWLRKRQVRCADKHEEIVENVHGDVDFSPERVLIGKARLAEATAIIMKLPERTRTVFILRRAEGLRYKDIAARLKISVSAVEKHMKKAVEYLASHLDN